MVPVINFSLWASEYQEPLRAAIGVGGKGRWFHKQCIRVVSIVNIRNGLCRLEVLILASMVLVNEVDVLRGLTINVVPAIHQDSYTRV